jgi:Na+-transporting NADH:ubiquinone oxidoreductase subunit NqrC
MNNFSIFTADRGTHVKIVVVSLIASIIVITVGITARTTTSDTASMQASSTIVRAAKPVMATTTGAGTIR